MLGDFNLVEDALDRLPSHEDAPGPVSKLDSFKSKIHLQDGWRTFNPTGREFSFLQHSTGAQSRIDRIYTTKEVASSATNWEIMRTAINTDHKMVSVSVVNAGTPFIGRGRWTMPLFLLKDKSLSRDIQEMGTILKT